MTAPGASDLLVNSRSRVVPLHANSSRVDQADSVARELSISCDDSKAFHGCLGDEHSIEWVAVMAGKSHDRQGVRDGDGERLEAVGGELGRQPRVHAEGTSSLPVLALIAISHALAALPGQY